MTTIISHKTMQQCVKHLTDVEINERICEEYMENVSDKLSDQSLLDKFLRSKSVKLRLDDLKNDMQDVGIEADKY